MSIPSMRMRSAVVVSLGSVALAAALRVALAAAQGRPAVVSLDAGSARFDGSVAADASASDAGDRADRADRVVCGPSERGVTFALESPSLESTCADGMRQCATTLAFIVRNCSDSRVSLDQVSLRSSSGGTLTLSYAPDWIEPRTQARRTRERFGDNDESGQLEFVAVDDRGGRFTGAAAISIRNAARARAQAACVACQGTWGRWGISQREGCNCRTADGGRACEDGADCEAGCVMTGWRTVSRGMVVAVGRCAERRMNFGCRTLIEAGARARGPVPRGGRPVRSTVCAD